MSDQPRDWDKELAEIDKVIAREPAGGTPSAQRVGAGGGPPIAVPRPAAPLPRRKERAGSWVRALFTVALGAALPFWPYPAACGFGLMLFSGAVGVLILAALWTATATWRRRQGLVHVLALLSLLWGILLAGSIILPRIGYARGSLTWICG